MQFKSAIKTMMLAACCLSGVMFASCGDDDDDSGLKFSATTVTVAPGKTQKVVVKGGTLPYTAKSADETTATVAVSKDTLIVTGAKASKTAITVIDKNKLSGSVAVNVSESSKKK